jgi:two-component system, OmpR family, response regulator
MPATDLTSPFRSVLYVDDDRDICSVVQATLRLVPGLIVDTAESGERAIDLAYELRPDLVLMDVMMPGLDGPSTFRCMQESKLLASIPVIFMTAKVLPTEISQFLRLGAIGVVVKPFDPLRLYTDLLALWNRGDSDSKPISSGGAQSRVLFQVDSLTFDFLERARADAVRLTYLIEMAKAGDRTVLKEVERIAHSIHGAGAMFGFPKLSEVGAAIAQMASGLGSRTGHAFVTNDSGTLQRLIEYSDQLASEVNTASQTAPQSSAMFQGSLTAR